MPFLLPWDRPEMDLLRHRKAQPFENGKRSVAPKAPLSPDSQVAAFIQMQRASLLSRPSSSREEGPDWPALSFRSHLRSSFPFYRKEARPCYLRMRQGILNRRLLGGFGWLGDVRASRSPRSRNRSFTGIPQGYASPREAAEELRVKFRINVNSVWP